MASGITIKVAMRPLFVDYLKSIYHSDANIIALHQTNLWHLVRELLTVTPQNYKPQKLQENNYAQFLLPFSKEVNINYKNYISDSSQKVISRWVHEKFYTSLRDHIDNWKSMPGFEINIAINHFCELHNINPDHYKVNSLYRDYYRHNQRKKHTEKFKKMSSTFAAFLSVLSPLLVLTLSYVL